MLTLRPYQQQATVNVKKAIARGVKRVVTKMATGLGKTPWFASLPDALDFKPGDQMVVLAHTEELIDQAVDKVKKWNPTRTVGVEMAERRSNGEDIIIASVPTIGRAGSARIKNLDPSRVKLIITDECHRAVGETYKRVFAYFKDAVSIGVTATPNRADQRGLAEVYDEIVFDMGILDGIREGWLSDLKGIRIKTTSNLDNVHTLGGDLNLGELTKEVNTTSRNERVVNAWLEHGQNRQSLVYAVDVQHAQDLADTFKRAGIAAEAVWGADPYRDEKLALHRKGTLKVLVNCQLLTEGYDDWRVGCIVLARPTKSETLYTQIVGRGTRIPEGIYNLLEAKKQGVEIAKQDCILIDVVDATTQHSLVSLPSLFGMNREMDLHGKSITQVMSEVEKIKKERPLVDVTKVTDIDNLRAYAEQVDLFRVQFAPEVVQLSDLQWHKTGERAYVLLLTDGESVTIIPDLLDKWHVYGTIRGTQVRKVCTSFEEAIREGDYQVKLWGGRSLNSLVKRTAKWHAEPPTPGQLLMCKRFKIAVPDGATKGEIHLKLNEVMGRKARTKAGVLR